MMHTKFYRELMAEQRDQSPPIETQEGESVDAKFHPKQSKKES